MIVGGWCWRHRSSYVGDLTGQCVRCECTFGSDMAMSEWWVLVGRKVVMRKKKIFDLLFKD